MRIAITLRQLEIFVAVARAGQVTQAARTLHLTQSATSMALAQLEKQLDIELFERQGRSLKLTERGRLLLAEGPDLLERVQQLPALLGGRGRELRGELRVAASTTVGRYLLAPTLAAFAQAHPAVAVQLIIGNTETATTALLSHRADIAYVEGSVVQAGLVAELWKTDELQIVASARRRKQRSAPLSRAEVAKLGWIMREPGSGTREVLENALRAAKLPPPKALLTLDDSEAVLQAVASGVGVACLSRLVVAESLRSKRLLVLQAPYLNLERALWEVTRDHSTSGPIQKALQMSLASNGRHAGFA
jgi:DNA-binding transcriptional LysR family regulator